MILDGKKLRDELLISYKEKISKETKKGKEREKKTRERKFQNKRKAKIRGKKPKNKREDEEETKGKKE